MARKAFAGKRDRRVEIFSFTTTKNTFNEDVETPVSEGVFWAALTDLSGSEQEEGKIIHLSLRGYNIVYNPQVDQNGTLMELHDQGKAYRIIHVDRIGRREQLFLKCEIRE